MVLIIHCLNELMLFGVIILPTKGRRLANKNLSHLSQESSRDSHNNTGYCHCPCLYHRPEGKTLLLKAPHTSDIGLGGIELEQT